MALTLRLLRLLKQELYNVSIQKTRQAPQQLGIIQMDLV